MSGRSKGFGIETGDIVLIGVAAGLYLWGDKILNIVGEPISKATQGAADIGSGFGRAIDLTDGSYGAGAWAAGFGNFIDLTNPAKYNWLGGSSTTATAPHIPAGVVRPTDVTWTGSAQQLATFNAWNAGTL